MAEWRVVTAAVLLFTANPTPVNAGAPESVPCTDPIRISVLPQSQYRYEGRVYSIEQLSEAIGKQSPERCVLVSGDPAAPDAWTREMVLQGALGAAGIRAEIAWPKLSAWLKRLTACRETPSTATCSSIPASEFSPYTAEQYIAESVKRGMAEKCLKALDGADYEGSDEPDPARWIAKEEIAARFFSELESLPGYMELARNFAVPTDTPLIDKVRMAFFALSAYSRPPDVRRTLANRLRAETILTKYMLLPLSPTCTQKFPL